MHNINVLYAITESVYLGGLPVRLSEVSLAPLVGVAYVLFTWNMTRMWAEPQHGPQFIYFFFDTTIPGYQPTIALLALLVTMLLFFFLFCASERLLLSMEDVGGIWGSIAFVVAICAGVMRFRD